MFRAFPILVLFLLFGCNTEVPLLDPRITEDDLKNTGKILESLNSIQLIDPISSPGYKANPTIRVSGVKPGTVVKAFLTSACTSPIASKTAETSIVDFIMPNLSEGVYNFYFSQSNQFTTSTCTKYPLQYQYVDGLPAPSEISLDIQFSTPSLDTQPRFKINGITSSAIVSIFSDQYCNVILGSTTALGANAFVQVTNPLNPGKYNIYTNQEYNGEISSCSTAYAEYEVLSTLPEPNLIQLVSPLQSPSSDKTPTIKVGGVIALNEVYLYRDPNCILEIAHAQAFATTVDVTVTTELSDGVYQIFALQKNENTNAKSACSTVNLSYQVDSATKDISSATLLDPIATPASDSTPKLRIYGVENYSTVTLYKNSICTQSIGSASSGVLGYVDITTSALAEGETKIYAKQVDGSGNPSACIGPLVNYIYDKTVLPPANLSLFSPTFTPNTDDTPTISVQGLENGAILKLFKESTCTNQVGNAIVGGGQAQVTTSVLVPGIYTFYATQTDKAGNVSACSSSSVNYEIISNSVSEPTSIFVSSPSTSPNNITTISVGVGGLIVGGHVYLYRDSLCNNLISSKTTATSTEYFAVSGLVAGEHKFYARQANTVGQFSNCSNAYASYEIDLNAVAPSGLSLVSPTVSPSSDTTPLIKVSGIEVGATVSIYKDNSCVNKIGQAVSISSTVNIEANLVQSGNYSIYAKQTDKFGNISPCSTAFLSYVLIVDGSTPSSISMISPVANEGNDTTPTLRVDGVTLGSIVYIYKDASCTQVVASGVSTNTYKDLTISEILTGDGNYYYYARQEINGGLSGCTSTPVAYRLDTVASKPTNITLIDPIVSPGNDNTPTISVAGLEVNGTVKIYKNAACTTLVESFSVDSTTMQLTFTNLNDGAYTFYAKQTDSVGNVSPCSDSSASYTLDTGASTPTFITLNSPATSPSTVTTPSVNVSGVEDAATVSVHTANTCSDATKVGQGIAVGTSALGINLGPLAVGTYTLYAKQRDILGNVSNCSSSSLNYQVVNSGGGSDPYFAQQWHLENDGSVTNGVSGEDINVTSVWAASNKGNDIHIRIVDDGLELAHPDLAQNIKAGASYDFIGNDTDPTPSSGGDSHGTSCGGVIGAVENNNIGVKGVAPLAKISGYNLLQTNSLADETVAMSGSITNVDISSNSWGPSDGFGIFAEPAASWVTAVETGLTNGRSSKGTVYVWAAGNGASVDNSNYDGYANFYGVMAVCGSEYTGSFADYSEPGANLWVCAPTANLAHEAGRAIATTDLVGSSRGQNTSGTSSDFTDKNYTKYFGGTSAAAPVVSGVASLVLKANPNLGWRDVKLILATTARKNDPTSALASGKGSSNTWQTNTAGISHHQDYGFGVVDADAAVAAAGTWSNVGTLKKETYNVAVGGTTLPYNTLVSSNKVVSGSTISQIEYVEIRVNINHVDWGELEISLEKSGSLRSDLSRQHFCYNNSNTHINCTVASNSFRFGSARYLNEAADGTWTLKITDKENTANANGSLNSWTMVIYGH